MALPLLPRFTVLLIIFLCTVFCVQTAELRNSETIRTRDEDESHLKSGDRESRPAFVGRRLAQDSWIDPFQERLPGQGSSNSLFKRWFGNKATSEVRSPGQD